MRNYTCQFRYVILSLYLLFFINLFAFNEDTWTRKLKYKTGQKLFNKGWYHYNKGEYKTSLNHFQNSLNYLHNDTTYLWIAKTYIQLNELDKAKKYLLKLSSTNRYINHLYSRVNVDSDIKNNIGLKKKYDIKKVFSNKAFFKNAIITPSDIFIDDKSNIFFVSYKENKIVKVDMAGKFLEKWPKNNDIKLNEPHSIYIFNKELYISDFGNDRIVIFNLKDDKYRFFGEKGTSFGQFLGPEGIIIDKNNNIFVIDRGNKRLQKFDKTGKFIMSINLKNDKINLDSPVDVSIDKEGNIYICNNSYKQNCIYKYDNSGNFLKSFGNKWVQYARSCFIFDGKIFVANNNISKDKLDRITCFDLGGQKLDNIVFNAKDIQKFKYISSIFIDQYSNMYISDYEKNNITVLSYKRFKKYDFNLKIKYTNVRFFPQINHYAEIRMKNKNISSLSSNSFIINEYDKDFDHTIQIKDVFIDNLKYKTNAYLLLVQNNNDSIKYLEKIKKTINKIIFNADQKAIMNYILYNDNVVYDTTGFTKNKNILQSQLDRKLDDAYQNDGNKIWDAMLEGIKMIDKKELLYYKKGIIVILVGLDGEKYSQYSYKKLLNYIKNINIPFYFIPMIKINKNQKIQNIIDISNGKYYTDYLLYNNNVHNDLNHLETGEYVIIYNTEEPKYIYNQWRDVIISMNYMGLVSQELCGYICPLME